MGLGLAWSWPISSGLGHVEAPGPRVEMYRLTSEWESLKAKKNEQLSETREKFFILKLGRSYIDRVQYLYYIEVEIYTKKVQNNVLQIHGAIASTAERALIAEELLGLSSNEMQSITEPIGRRTCLRFKLNVSTELDTLHLFLFTLRVPMFTCVFQDRSFLICPPLFKLMQHSPSPWKASRSNFPQKNQLYTTAIYHYNQWMHCR